LKLGSGNFGIWVPKLGFLGYFDDEMLIRINVTPRKHSLTAKHAVSAVWSAEAYTKRGRVKYGKVGKVV
jgi:hypothetical protein